MEQGLLVAGDGLISMEYKGQATTAGLAEDGRICWQGARGAPRGGGGGVRGRGSAAGCARQRPRGRRRAAASSPAHRGSGGQRARRPLPPRSRPPSYPHDPSAAQGMHFDSPSAFSIFVKRLTTPGRKADDGWKTVRYAGQQLERYKHDYLRARGGGGGGGDASGVAAGGGGGGGGGASRPASSGGAPTPGVSSAPALAPAPWPPPPGSRADSAAAGPPARKRVRIQDGPSPLGGDGGGWVERVEHTPRPDDLAALPPAQHAFAPPPLDVPVDGGAPEPLPGGGGRRWFTSGGQGARACASSSRPGYRLRGTAGPRGGCAPGTAVAVAFAAHSRPLPAPRPPPVRQGPSSRPWSGSGPTATRATSPTRPAGAAAASAPTRRRRPRPVAARAAAAASRSGGRGATCVRQRG
jgi:hypothetical protein